MPERNPLKAHRAALLAWHDEITRRKEPRGRLLGEGARLRRAASLDEVAFLPGYHELLHHLREDGLEIQPADRERFALLAWLAAWVKEHRPSTQGETLARRLASPAEGSDRPVMSEPRLRRLLECETAEELRLPLRRAIDLLGRKLDVVQLAEDVFAWSQSVRKRWAYDYYDALPRTSGTSPAAGETKGEAA